MFGRGRHPTKPGKMNRWEKAWEAHLKEQLEAREILWYEWDCISLRLAKGCHYRPDFVVMKTDLTIEVHEVKGHWEDDALVKIKTAAGMYPFHFFAMTLARGHWKTREF